MFVGCVEFRYYFADTVLFNLRYLEKVVYNFYPALFIFFVLVICRNQILVDVGETQDLCLAKIAPVIAVVARHPQYVLH